MESRPILARNKSNIELSDRNSFIGVDLFKKECIGEELLIGAAKAKMQRNPFGRAENHSKKQTRSTGTSAALNPSRICKENKNKKIV